MQELFTEGESLKSELLEVWRNNIDFVNGNQVVYWDFASGRFRTKTLPAKQKLAASDYIYVTNELTPIARTITSFMTRNRPTVKVCPSDPNDDFSVRRAMVAENFQWAKWEIDQENLKHEQFANWVLACGTVFRKDSWNSSARGTRQLSEEEQSEDQPPALLTSSDEEGFDQHKFLSAINSLSGASGQQEGEDESEGGHSESSNEVHWGDSEVGVLTGFNINVDFNAKDDNYEWIEEYALQPIDWVKSNYSRKNQYFTGRGGEVKATEKFGNALDIDLSLRFRTHNNSGQKPKIKDMCLFREFYQKPRFDAPWNKGKDYEDWQGTMIVMANDIVLYVGPSPYKNWNPYTPFGYEPYLGRFWSRSLWEQLIPLQCRLNELNGAIVKNAKTVAKPKWVVLDGSVDEGALSGSEDKPLFYKYNASIGSPVAPQLHSGIPLPAQFFNERAALIETMARISGSNLIMQGNNPTGVTAAAALQLLLESANSQYGPLINGWEKFIERGQTNKLVLFQRMCREPRSDIFEMLTKKKRDLTELDVAAFTGETIEDNLTVEVEAGSSIPKSQAARQNQVMELGKMGVLGDIVNDPITNQQFLSEFGITEFNKKINAEWEKVKWENSRILKGQPPSPSPRDNHQMHLSEHIAETQKPSYIERSSDQVKQMMEEHIAFHEGQLQQAQAGAEEQQKSQMMEVAQAQNQMEIQKDVAGEQAKTDGKKEQLAFEKTLEAPQPITGLDNQNFNQIQ